VRVKISVPPAAATKGVEYHGLKDSQHDTQMPSPTRLERNTCLYGVSAGKFHGISGEAMGMENGRSRREEKIRCH
jgi:hypothetical protein